jgi:hypothetical protein
MRHMPSELVLELQKKSEPKGCWKGRGREKIIA